MYPRIDLDPKKLKNFTRHKHPWIFSGAVHRLSLPKEQLHGQLVNVYCDNKFIMIGYFNQLSQIAIRALYWGNPEDTDQNTPEIDQEFFKEKLHQALSLRKQFVLNEKTTACRLVFAESDFLPGFVLDKYNNSYILQIHTLGAENLKKIFVEALIETTQEIFGQKPDMVMENSDISSRKHEGMDPVNHQLLYGKKIDQETILENGHKFAVDFEQGQKTGFFLDQRDNRQTIQKYCQGKKVLNLFSYTGGFSVYASAAGASQVDSIDISQPAIKQCTKNLELNNNQAKHQEVQADAFDYLGQLTENQYDIIIIDPPAFVKSIKRMQEGVKGYISINQLALQAISENGLLITSSCSAALNDQDFFRMLNWAANAANCQIQVVEKKAQPTDHPLTPYFPEGEYLKFYVIRKIQI